MVGIVGMVMAVSEDTSVEVRKRTKEFQLFVYKFLYMQGAKFAGRLTNGLKSKIRELEKELGDLENASPKHPRKPKRQ
ncbi:MAG: hypothetical protein HYS87_03570 [Candidatus Colwellbacteria bacterium]|nr:hypothetical protein [Candidatus Colwellbacteria bacterium]